jgi:DNA polymerase-4
MSDGSRITDAGVEPHAREATILHVDMDAFYAAVEVLADPSLAGRPVIVGGAGRRGVVASCSYEARAFGVRSAMPSAQARRLCPQAVFVAGRHDAYADYSRRIHEVFKSFTPLVEGIALDEAFLDVAGAQRLFGPAPAIAVMIRERIDRELGLAASVGVASSKFIAKLASETAKPRAGLDGVVAGRGVVVVEPGTELSFLHPLPVEALWGVGPATATRLRRLGVTTIGDLSAVPVETLEHILGRAAGRHLHDLSWARDGRAVEPDRDVKSISHEETYGHDRDDRAQLHGEVIRMADAVAARLRAAGRVCRTVTLKVRFGSFATITRATTLATPAATGVALGRVAAALLDQVDVAPGVRLLGVSASNLSAPADVQLAWRWEEAAVTGAAGPRGGPDDHRTGPEAGLDRPADGRSLAPGEDAGDPGEAWVQTTDAVDAIRQRFGDAAVGPAVLLGTEGLRVKRRGDTQWGPAGGV